MAHDTHKHAHCAHTHLAYCALCQVVYCHDCSQEFVPKQTWWGTTYTYSGTTLPGSNQYGFRAMTQPDLTTTLGTHQHGS